MYFSSWTFHNYWKKNISVLFPKLCLLNRHQFLLLFKLINAPFSAVLIAATLITRALSLPTLFLVALFIFEEKTTSL